jgi:serine-type D-Ala-D-Ala endopeptidase (penicillin-binding protein 7)
MVKKVLFLIVLSNVCAVFAAQAAQQNNSASALHVKASKIYNALPQLRSSIALIYDEQEQVPIYSKGADTVVSIASISKLMTAMVLLDAQLSLDEVITISEQDVDKLKYSRSRMRVGTAFTRAEMLKLALMASENRAAAALARTFPGGKKAAIAKMNEKARELGMLNTRFVDASGLNSGNISTARDLVKMLMAAQSYDLIHTYSTAPSHIVSAQGHRPQRFGNTNPLVKNASWDIGISKTGYTKEAGRCLVMQASIMNRPIIVILLDSDGKNSRIGDANRIKTWIEHTAQSELISTVSN